MTDKNEQRSREIAENHWEYWFSPSEAQKARMREAVASALDAAEQRGLREGLGRAITFALMQAHMQEELDTATARKGPVAHSPDAMKWRKMVGALRALIDSPEQDEANDARGK